MLNDLFKNFYYQYISILNENNLKVDRSQKYYQILIHEIPNKLRTHYQKNQYKIYGSVGQGNLSQIPWVGIFNRHITESATFGLYIVYLYSIEFKKLFLTLNQGFTHFSEIYKKNKYEYIRKTAEYFSNEMKLNGYSKDIPKLAQNTTKLAKGYEYGTIVYKAYDIDNMPDEKSMLLDLDILMKEYDELVLSFGTKSYNDIIKIVNGTDETLTVDKALSMIKTELDENFKVPIDIIPTPIPVKKGKTKTTKYARIKNTILRQKLDYVRIAKDNARIGLQGEKLALQIEKERLEKLGIKHIDKKITWRSIESDSYGYDIESVDIINGKETTIYIEVKTTSDRIDSPFYVTKKEKEFSEKTDIQYRILRIFDVDSTKPKYYYAEGSLERNFILDPITYLATYKYEIEL